MAKANRVRSTPRRTASKKPAAVPTTAPAMPPHSSDCRLVAAAEGVFASEAAIDQIYREHHAAGADGDADERADCQALFDLQGQHTDTLITVPAASNAGFRAKASVVRAGFMVGRRNHDRIALSLANDLVGGGASAVLPSADAQTAPDPVYAVIESHKAASIAYDKAVNHPAVGDSRHPQRAEAERISVRTQNELRAQAKRLFGFQPSTSAGVASLLRYISSLPVWQMPGHFSEPREIKGMKDLCKSLAAALEAADGKAVQS